MPGFTLVEMAVVVTLIGILMALGIATAMSVMQNTQRSTTKDRQAFVRDALVAYFTQNHRFPCPDNGGATVRDGVQDLGGGGGCATNFGTVPYATLGISNEKALDAYGNFLSYRLDITNGWHLSATFPAGACPSAPVSGLAVFNAPAGPSNAGAVVLISHGANGFGAWNQGTSSASRNTLPTTAQELGNTLDAPTVPAGYRNYVYSDTAAAPFDDMVLPVMLGDLTSVMLTKMGRANICS
jgi:prepilin-type N-terminal cleavage/methylation domain-containing protein